MDRVVLVDTGPVVAALDKRDARHRWASDVFSGLTSPCITCEAVLSECFFLLEHLKQGKRRLLELLERGVIKVAFDFEDSRADVLHLMHKYDDTPMSFADACLVRMSEVFRHGVVLTCDSDFKHYRRFDRRTIPLMTPW
jgi:uncharacterized protein